MQDRDFYNYQRILSGYPSISFMLLGFHITVTIAGLAGLFVLMRSDIPPQQIISWVTVLAFLITFVTVMLWLMWFREHILKDQVVTELLKEKVRFPETTAWNGVVTAMHTGFYMLGIVFWGSLIVVAIANPQWLLKKFGL
ncbi:hypothetical protein SCL_1128 [Sulfuricaulis limicola]|uniref:Uncharacterized protein n=1 Tax=Sulfuricaulis limicola TaxID=1620215 RepID=A0A1B4XF64_9GAMM|nr:hypothetical protein [Sulfuricaulis limicola]BAV33441.1 hypothetical protein SCL_1128 [Sulfuricaulis limicola]